jgi:predicted TIM-barrel fold metal-dependent hydrolase
MATVTPVRDPRKRREQRLALIDCDVHNATKSRAELKRYLPARWHVEFDHGSHIAGHGGQVIGARPQRDIFRRDSMPREGTPGSDYELMREQLLDRHNVVKALLHPISEVLASPTYGEFGEAVAAAINDWMVDQWLGVDDRLYGAISIPVEDGARAAYEIERAARQKRFVKVMLPMITREGMGHPKYWPIYEAAAGLGLPIAAHVGGFSGTHLAVGWPTYFVEQHAGYTQPYQAQVVSLVYSGVFDRFPNLVVVLEEGGLSWMPPLMWRLDHSWENMREHVPGLKDRPSDVIRRHFAFTTQPLDEPEEPKFLVQVLEQLQMNDRIMFSSDYPHWDFDDPERVLPQSLVGDELRGKIFRGNAERLFKFDR